jgi:Type I restriction enzyme R protein N terminus (HSDR_N)
MPDFWSSIPTVDALRGEGNVEHRLVLRLLHALGYEDHEIEAKYPVVFQEGRLGRKPEADFVCFYGPLRDRNNSLLVVEAKQPGEKLPPGKAQGESYAQNLRAPLLLLTNGEILEIWQMQITLESQRVLSIPVASLVSQRGNVERLLNKAAVRDYCRSLSSKTIVEATADFGVYETAELKRMLRDQPSIARTLRRAKTAIQSATLETTRLLSDFPLGAIVVAPSGYGKTTLSRDVFKRAIEERWRGNRTSLPFEVPLPDFEQSGVSLVTFVQQRLSAHCPGVTAASFLTTLRDTGATIFCDSFDRTTAQFQKRATTEFANLLRDYPRAQLFIFSRAAFKPDVPLPWLELDPLSDEQVRELEKVILNDGSAQNFSIVGMMSPTLRSLCVNPLLLRLALDYWKREQDFPRRIEFLFRSWIDTVLETEPSDFVSRVQREQALTTLAEATAIGPITSGDAVARLGDRAIPAAVLNELIQCNAVRMTGAVVELQHEGLADYLRAKTFAAMSEPQLSQEIPALPVQADSFFPVLLMAQLASRSLQSALWKRMSTGRVSIYLVALRYRFDVSNQLRELDSDRLSQDYLNDLIDGIEVPLTGFFPEMRPSVMGHLTGVTDAPLSATGSAQAYPGALYYKLHPSEPGQPRVTVATPTFPGTIRGVNLDLSRYRIDSARLLGMTLLRDALLQGAVKQLNVKGGATWAAERLIGRVRYLAKNCGFDVGLNEELDKLDAVLKPLAGGWINEGSFLGDERFSMQSLLDDVTKLRAAGETALDPWWSRLGWDDDALMVEEDIYRAVLDEEYRRVQKVYAEIVEAAFPNMAGEAIHFPILPIRWKLTVVRRDRREGLSTIGLDWIPVESWDDAGADVSFADKLPGGIRDFQGVCAALTKLGRPAARLPGLVGWTRQQQYDGSTLDGHFDGMTPVVSTVCSWLKDDLKHLFEGLPASDGSF